MPGYVLTYIGPSLRTVRECNQSHTVVIGEPKHYEFLAENDEDARARASSFLGAGSVTSNKVTQRREGTCLQKKILRPIEQY